MPWFSSGRVFSSHPNVPFLGTVGDGRWHSGELATAPAPSRRVKKELTRATVSGVLIYKILLPAEWAEFEATGHFDGSPVDRRDGFIHCAVRDQLAGTAVRYFGDQPDLVVLGLDPLVLGAWLRWETTHNLGPFPHVYAPLPRAAVAAVHRIAGASSVDAVVPSG